MSFAHSAAFAFQTPPLLSQAVFDRADHLRDDAERLAAGWARAQVLLVDERGRYPVDATGALRWTSAVDVGAQPVADAVFLGVLGETDLWALRRGEVAEPLGEPRSGAHLLSGDEAGLVATALGVLNWHRSAAFSPSDGSPTTSVRLVTPSAPSNVTGAFPATVFHHEPSKSSVFIHSFWSNRMSALAEIRAPKGASSRTFTRNEAWPSPQPVSLSFGGRKPSAAETGQYP